MPCEWTFFRREPKPSMQRRNDMERCETLGEEVRLIFPPRSRWRSFFRDFDPWKMRAWPFSSIFHSECISIFATVETWCESPPVELEEWKECCKQLSERCRRCAVRHTSQIHGLAGPIHWWRYMNTSGGSYTYRPFQCGGKRKHDLQKCLFLGGEYVSCLEGNVIWEWCTNLPTHQFFAGGLVIC